MKYDVSNGERLASTSDDEPPETLDVPSFSVPLSSYMSHEAKQALLKQISHPINWVGENIDTSRRNIDKLLFQPMLDQALQRYSVSISEEYSLAGVPVIEVIPSQGLPARNYDKVLINLHGGAFCVGGGGVCGLVESIPISAVGEYRVISVDYRQGPEHRFPAASEDVAAVYTELLKTHHPSQVGIFGCSAGGLLASMTIAWLDHVGLPMPGAVGLFFGSADLPLGGDSSFVSFALSGAPVPPSSPNPPIYPVQYLSEVDLRSPLVSPSACPELLSKFPKTLIISGTRAMEFSAAIHSNNLLLRAGVDVRLQIWDGMWHAFFYDVEIPESRDAFDAISRFFDASLR